MIVSPGTTSLILTIQVVDDTGLGVAGLVAATFPPTSFVIGTNAAGTSITLSDLSLITSAYSSGGVKERTASGETGFYRLDIPNAAIASAGTVKVVGEASGKHILCDTISVQYAPANIGQWLGVAVTADANNAPNVSVKYWAAVAVANAGDSLPIVHASNLVLANLQAVNNDGTAASNFGRAFSAAVNAAGSVGFGIVPTQGDVIMIPNGMTSVTKSYLCTTTPSAPTDIDISSGDPTTIAIAATSVVNTAAYGITAVHSGQGVNLTVSIAGAAGNVSITQTGSGTTLISGFSGGDDAGWGINYTVAAGAQAINSDATIAGPVTLTSAYDAAKAAASQTSVNTLQTAVTGIASGATVVRANNSAGVLIPSAAQIDTELSGTHGSGAWGGGSDPWATSLPGAYSAGQAGYILGGHVVLPTPQNFNNTGQTTPVPSDSIVVQEISIKN